MLMYTDHLEFDEVSGQSWQQLLTAVCDEGDGMTLCEQLSQGYGALHVVSHSNCHSGDCSAISQMCVPVVQQIFHIQVLTIDVV